MHQMRFYGRFERRFCGRWLWRGTMPQSPHEKANQRGLSVLRCNLLLIVRVSIKICYCVHIVSSTPELPIPVLKFHVAPSLIYHQTAFSFQKSHESWHTHLWRDTYQHMNMIGAYFRFYDFYSFPPTQLPKYCPDLNPFLFIKYFPSVFWCKHHMILAIPLCMC